MAVFLDLNHGNFMPRRKMQPEADRAADWRFHHDRANSLLRFAP
jgi:hypothetical protein